MKNKKLLTLPLIALALIGCNRTSTSSSTTQDISGSQSESTVETSKTTTDAETSIDSTTSITTSTVEDQASADSSTSSREEESEAPITSPWSSDITKLFNQHLGGHILPYINLGSGTFGEWTVGYTDYGVLTIEAGNVEWDNDTTYNMLETTYAASEYTVDTTTNSTKFVATSKDGTVHVTITKKSTTDKTITIKATYDEPYDKTKALSDWDSELKQEIIDTIGESIPYIYLGVQYPAISTDYYGTKFYLVGGKWNTAVVNDAKETLTNANVNAVFSDETEGGFTCKIPMTTSKDTIVLKLCQYGSSYPKIRLELSVVETFDETAADKWESDITDLFTDHLDGHQIPFVYLGSKQPEANFSSYDNMLYIDGNIWDDKILTLAKKAFEEDKSDNTTWDSQIDQSTKTFTATKTIPADECQLSVKIYKYSSYYGNSTYPRMEISFKEGMKIPSDKTDWSESTQKVISAHLPSSFNLPYVYLNLKNGAIEDASWDDNTNTLTILGGNYITAVYDKAKEVFEAEKEDDNTTASWTITTSTSSPYLTMTHKDKTSGDEFTVKVGKEYDSSTGANVAYLSCTYFEKYKVPENATNYSQDTQDKINKYFHGHELPYVYMRTLNDTATFYTSSNELDIIGDKFDVDMLTEAEKNFKAKNWTTSIKDEEFNASITCDDKCVLTAKMYKGNQDKARIEFTLKESYNLETAPDSWNEDTAKKITTNFPGFTLPYLYLGTMNETATYYSYYSYLSIVGSCWNKNIIADAKTTFTSQGFTYEEAKYGTAKAALFVKEDTTNQMFYSIMLMNDGGKPTLKVFKCSTTGTDGASATTQAYGDTITPTIKTNNGGYEIPFIDLGTNTLSATYYSAAKYAQITSDSKVSNYQLYREYKTLKANENYTCQINFYSSEFYFTATTKNADQSKTTIQVKNGSYTAQIDVYYSKPFVKSDDVTGWTSATESEMKQYLDGTVIPYFYMGSDNPTTSYNSYYNELTLQGEIWDDEVYTNCEEALKNDKDEEGNCKWSFIYDYSETKTLVAVTNTEDGYITLKLYKSTSSNAYPVLELYYTQA